MGEPIKVGPSFEMCFECSGDNGDGYGEIQHKPNCKKAIGLAEHIHRCMGCVGTRVHSGDHECICGAVRADGGEWREAGGVKDIAEFRIKQLREYYSAPSDKALETGWNGTKASDEEILALLDVYERRTKG